MNPSTIFTQCKPYNFFSTQVREWLHPAYAPLASLEPEKSIVEESLAPAALVLDADAVPALHALYTTRVNTLPMGALGGRGEGGDA